MSTRIKICGITRPADARAAVAAGADAIGLVFYKPSPRSVDMATAQAIIRELPPFVASVGLFVDAKPGEIAMVLSQVRLTTLQFHGDESPEECERYDWPYLKAIRMADDVDIMDAQRRYAKAQGLLLDTYQKDRPGGTGRAFDWDRIPQGLEKPLVLAGGLDADNVQRAIMRARPYAVDVSGGVESAPGLKDQSRMELFCHRVREAG
ncbi:MAG TPA: phosphoribosylanthranilate isomerase [Acidiferrobacter sp.]|nr:phosphoribosylanthranilate isomerase [Acidiferrobacter sp.]